MAQWQFCRTGLPDASQRFCGGDRCERVFMRQSYAADRQWGSNPPAGALRRTKNVLLRQPERCHMKLQVPWFKPAAWGVILGTVATMIVGLHLVGLDPRQHRGAHGGGTNQHRRGRRAHPRLRHDLHAAARRGRRASPSFRRSSRGGSSGSSSKPAAGPRRGETSQPTRDWRLHAPRRSRSPRHSVRDPKSSGAAHPLGGSSRAVSVEGSSMATHSKTNRAVQRLRRLARRRRVADLKKARGLGSAPSVRRTPASPRHQLTTEMDRGAAMLAVIMDVYEGGRDLPPGLGAERASAECAGNGWHRRPEALLRGMPSRVRVTR